MTNDKKVTIYTDGACNGNPGPGGYGTVLLYKTHKKELFGGFRLTTNNRMEIFAAIVGLETLKTVCVVDLYSDSLYLVDAMAKKWAHRWRDYGGYRDKKRTKEAKNFDLWLRLLNLCDKYDVVFRWVRGHSGDVLNERCDTLATNAISLCELQIDCGYMGSSNA